MEVKYKSVTNKLICDGLKNPWKKIILLCNNTTPFYLNNIGKKEKKKRKE